MLSAGLIDEVTRHSVAALSDRKQDSLNPYWQTVPGAQGALKEPFTVTELVPPVSVAEKVNVP